MRTTAKMGLTSWDQPTDPYNYAQLAGNWQIVDYHDHSPGRGVPISAGGLAPGAVLTNSIASGVIGNQHLSAALAQSASVNQASQVVKGAFALATAQSTSSTTFTSLTTPDIVSNLVVPANALIEIGYQAQWFSSIASAGSAAIFIGASQLQLIATTTATAPAVQAATGTAANIVTPLGTTPTGLASGSQTANYTGDVTTGQILTPHGAAGGVVTVFNLAAGTYNIGIQFKASSGSVTVQNRHLWVEVLSFV